MPLHLPLLAAHLHEVGIPGRAAAVDRRRRAMPATDTRDRFGAVLVLSNHMLGRIGGGRFMRETWVHRTPPGFARTRFASPSGGPRPECAATVVSLGTGQGCAPRP